MRLDFTLRYTLELAMILPAVIFAVMPVTNHVRPGIFAWICPVAVGAVIFSAAYFGAWQRIRVRIMMLPVAAVIFAMYAILFDTEAGKKLFCFFNAAMLSLSCHMYAVYLVAPLEILNFSPVFLMPSGFLSLGISVIMGAIFFRTLTVKLPMLMSHDSIQDIWRRMFILPCAMSALLYWMTPNSPRVILTGRVRPVALALITTIMVMIFTLYHIFWRITERITEQARLRRENDLLSMESKRYYELQSYMQRTRELRHDFRQHILVIAGLADNGRISELKEYVAGIVRNSGQTYKSFCVNKAVDAVASHYDRTAESQGTPITWKIDLPASLPVSEPDFCAMLGNLLENALNASKKLPPEKRRVNVMSSMLSDVMLGISIDNTYDGAITWKDGLPVSSAKGHGTGLISVRNTVNHYGGHMDINAGSEIFSVDIILYGISSRT